MLGHAGRTDRPTRRRRLRIAGLLVAFAAASCGSSGDAETDAAPTTLAEPDATSTTVAEADEPPVTPEPTVPSDALEPSVPAVESSTSLVTTTSAAPTPPPTPQGADLVWGKDATAPDPSWQAPDLGGSYADVAYGTSIRRMTSADGTRFDRNTYSRRQAENADGTMIFTYHGTAEYHVIERAGPSLVRALPIHPDAEPQWHPTNPNLIRYIAGPNSSVGDLELYEIDVTTGESRSIADLTNRIVGLFPQAVFLMDRAEGSPSADGNRYAWMVFDGDGQRVGIVSYDLATDQILGSTDQFEHDPSTLDAISMSPSGRFIVASYWDGVYAYTVDFADRRQLGTKAEHSDIAVNAAGNDSFVHIVFADVEDGGWLVADDLVTGERVRIFDLYDNANTSIHISGKGFDRPGWVIVSTYSCKVPGAWSCDKVMAVELADNGRILNLAHTHNCGEDYWTETHAVTNRDLSRVYFNTDSGSCGIDAEVMEITVPTFG